jgi:hypothetical protein
MQTIIPNVYLQDEWTDKMQSTFARKQSPTERVWVINKTDKNWTTLLNATNPAFSLQVVTLW